MRAVQNDLASIEALVARQFASLNWRRGETADWKAFEADFLPGAALYPSARPAAAVSVADFVGRMKGLADTTLHSFEETLLGTKIRVFGNVAVAAAACEAVDNGTDTGRTVEMMLLVKTDGVWRVVAQAWDKAAPSNPVPDWLLDSSPRT